MSTTTTTIFYVYRGPSATRVNVPKAPVVKSVSLMKRFQKQNLVTKKDEVNNNLKIYYGKKNTKKHTVLLT